MRRSLVLLVGIGFVVGLGAMVLLRGATSTVAEHVGDQQIAVECTGWTGVSQGCFDWGNDVMAQGAPSNTFELEDVVRVRLDRPMLGFAGTCVAEYFLSRYPDQVAWSEDVPCPDG
jgi:hypothetical protein